MSMELSLIFSGSVILSLGRLEMFPWWFKGDAHQRSLHIWGALPVCLPSIHTFSTLPLEAARQATEKRSKPDLFPHTLAQLLLYLEGQTCGRQRSSSS